MATIDIPTFIQHAQPGDEDGLPLNSPLCRLGGGYETDVYRTIDERFVVKLKRAGYRGRTMAQAQARVLRAISEHFVTCLGAEHSLQSTFVVVNDHDGASHVMTIQPFLKDARPLYSVDYRALTRAQRQHIMAQIHTLIRRAQACYRATGLMPDLYGVSGGSAAELARVRAPYMAPVNVWNFLITRTLLRSHNLLLTSDHRVVLVDYDLVMLHKPHLLRRIYFALRAVLFWRDLAEVRRHSNQ